MTRKANLTNGKISTLLTKLTIPMIAGMLSMVIFNLVDTFFIGKLGEDQLAAMGFTFPIIMIIVSISVGLGMGTSAVISREIGKGSNKLIRHLATNSLLLGFPVVLVFAIVGSLTIEPLFRLMGAEGIILEYIKEYMQIWYIGVPFVVIPMIGNNIIRATGDMKTPGLIMVGIALFNGFLDPLLVFGIGPFPEMGMAGGALATVISRAVGMTLAFLILIKREKLILFVVPKIHNLLNSWKRILFIAIPAALSKLIIPISLGVITRLVSQFGNSAVAGFGVATKLESLAMMIVIALSSVLIPFTGQNMGAGLKHRVIKALKLSFLFSFAWGIVMFIVFLFTGSFFAKLFNTNPEIVATVVLYLNIVSISYGFQGFINISSAVLNGSHKPIHSAILSITRMFILYVPLALIGAKLFNLKGIFLAGSIANFATGMLALLFIYRQIVVKSKRNN